MVEKVIQRAEDLQPAIISRFQRVIAAHELAHAYLLVGPSGSGKSAIADWLAMRLFCQHPEDNAPDGTCPECERILSHNHPDVIIARPAGRQLKVDQLRRLKAEFTKSGMEGSRKVFIINDAEKMTVNAANSLLKFIEEPGPGIYILMLTTNKSAILPTIQSRTQVVELQPLAPAKLTEELANAGISKSLQPIVRGLTDSVTDAETLTADDWLTHAVQTTVDWYKQVVAGSLLSFVMIQTDWLKLATDRLRQQVLLDLQTMIWRDTLLLANGVGKKELHFQMARPIIEKTAHHYSKRQLLAASELTLKTRRMLDGNVSFQNVSEQLTIRLHNALRGRGNQNG